MESDGTMPSYGHTSWVRPCADHPCFIVGACALVIGRVPMTVSSPVYVFEATDRDRTGP